MHFFYQHWVGLYKAGDIKGIASAPRNSQRLKTIQCYSETYWKKPCTYHCNGWGENKQLSQKYLIHSPACKTTFCGDYFKPGSIRMIGTLSLIVTNNQRKGSTFLLWLLCLFHTCILILPSFSHLPLLSTLSKTLWHQCFARPLLNNFIDLCHCIPKCQSHISEHGLLNWNNKWKPASASHLAIRMDSLTQPNNVHCPVAKLALIQMDALHMNN